MFKLYKYGFVMRVVLYTLILSVSFSSLAFAGFEWVPPTQNPKQMGTPQFDFPIAPPATRDRVTSEPLPLGTIGGAIYNTNVRTSDRPQSPSLANPNFQNNGRLTTGNANRNIIRNTGNTTRPNLQASPDKPVSLYINPYPLGRNNAGVGGAVTSTQSIEQAMVQQIGRVTPMPLGNGMQTGAQAGIETMAPLSTPAKAMMIEKMDAMPAAPVMARTTRSAPRNILPQNISPQNFAPKFAEAEGFGTALPLALALSQVIPSDFNHNFAPGVDPGTTVSWQGGKSWDEVLKDMLRPSGLTASIQNNAVTIQPLTRL